MAKRTYTRRGNPAVPPPGAMKVEQDEPEEKNEETPSAPPEKKYEVEIPDQLAKLLDAEDWRSAFLMKKWNPGKICKPDPGFPKNVLGTMNAVMKARSDCRFCGRREFWNRSYGPQCLGCGKVRG